MTTAHLERIAYVFDAAADEFDSADTAFFAPLGAELARVAGSRAGDSVLDIGCGSGSSLIPTAVRVGPSGSVLGVDISAKMVQRCRSEVSRRALHNAEVRVMDAEQPDFAPEEFDIAQAGFSIMHFSNAPRSLSVYTDLLRGSGLLCVSALVDVDGLPSCVPQEAFDVLEPYFPHDVADPRERGRDSWTDTPQTARQALSDIGFARVDIDDQSHVLRLSTGQEWNRWTMSTGLREAWMNMSPTELGDCAARTAAVIEDRRSEGHISLPVDVRYIRAFAR